MNKTIEAAREFMAKRYLNYEDAPHVSSMMADFSDQQNAELKAEVEKLREKLQTIFGRAMAFQPDTPGENVILYRWVGEIKALARIEDK
jgi:hypothetical protein